MTFGEQLRQMIREALIEAAKDRHGELTDIAKAGGRETHQGLLGDVGLLTDIVSTILSDVPFIGPLLDLPLRVVKEAEGKGGRFGSGIGFGYLLGTVAWQYLQPLLRLGTHEIEHIFNTEIFDPGTAAELTAKGIITHGHGAAEASGAGFDGDHFSAMTEGKFEYPELAELLQLLNRELVTEGDVDHALHHHQVPEEWRRRLLGLRRQLLSGADLALAQLRGHITIEVAEGYARQLGIDRDDLDVLIANTGEPPGLMQLLEAYRRDFMDRERLVRGIKQSRVRDEWIDVVEKLRYSPMSTADAAKAVIEGYLHEHEGKAIAQQNGLEPAHWPIVRESWGRPLSHGQMTELYNRGEASREQVDQAFRESDLKDKYRVMSFELRRHMLGIRQIIDAMKYGAISVQEGGRMLLQQGYSTADTKVIMRLGLAEGGTNAKTMTAAQVIGSYEQHLMGKADALTHLEKLGYSKADAASMIALADAKTHAAGVRSEQQAIRASFLDGRLTAHQADAELIGLGLDKHQADHLVAVWGHEHGAKGRRLSESQILHAAEKGTLTRAEALTDLEAIGYSERDATVLIDSHSVK